jgi:hypothetical protein
MLVEGPLIVAASVVAMAVHVILISRPAKLWTTEQFTPLMGSCSTSPMNALTLSLKAKVAATIMLFTFNVAWLVP